MIKHGGSPLRREATDTMDASGGRWVCDLAQGILAPSNTDSVRLRLKPVVPSYVELGFPSLSSIPIADHLAERHPLKCFISQQKPLGLDDLDRILRHPALDLSLVGFHSGTVTAAVHEQLMTASRVGVEDYSRNMWARDGIITATALNRAGFSDKAHQIVRNLWSFAGNEQQRGKILQFHW